MNGEYELLDETGTPHYFQIKSRTMPTTLKAGFNNLTLRFDSEEMLINSKRGFEFGETRFNKDGCTASITIRKICHEEKEYYSCKVTVVGNELNIIRDMIDELDQRLFGTKILDWDTFVGPKSFNFIDKLKWIFS